MAYSQAQNKANQRYQNKTYDRIAIRLKKGRREEMKEIAAAADLSLAKLIEISVKEYAENHGISTENHTEKATDGDSLEEEDTARTDQTERTDQE